MKLQLSSWVHAALVPAFALGLTSQDTLAATSGQGQAGASSSAMQKQAYRGLRATQLIGKEVKSSQGKNLGQLEDLIVDMDTGRVRYSILRFDPGILSGEKLIAVPVSELRLSNDRDELVYDMTRARLEKAGVDKKNWPGALRDREYLSGLDRVYGIVQPSTNRRAFSAADLLGKDVNNRQGKDIGQIRDLVINMSAQSVHFAVLAFDPSWTAPEKLYAFPLRAFTFTDGTDELTLEVDKTTLQAMRSFDPKLWTSLRDSVFIADMDRHLVTVKPVMKSPGSPAAR